MVENRHAILCVDDEKNVLSSLKRLLRKEDYDVLTASSGHAGLKVLSESKIHLVMCDQRMTEMSGTEFLAQVKDAYPDVIRIMLTGYTEVDSITESINKGHIYKFFLKPWNDHNLKLEIRQALEHYELIQTNRELHKKVLKQNAALKSINENLEDLVSQRTEELEYKNQALELSRTILEDLPIPIVGISIEGMIVMTNRAAQVIFNEKNPLELGRQATDYFSRSILEAVRLALESDSLRKGSSILLEGPKCDFQCSPLSGKFRGKGVVLSFRKSAI